MKSLIAAISCALLLAAAAVAAAPAADAKAAAAARKPAAGKSTKSSQKTNAAKANAVKAIEEATPVDDDPDVNLSAEELETAKKVYTGDIPCELGAMVHITPHKREGFFIVRAGIQRFRMQPVASRTGAIRLEDPRAGAMWLQLGNKSMLMSQKMGQRLADDCMAPAQAQMAEVLKKNPMPSLLEPLPPAKAAASAAETPAVQAPQSTTISPAGAAQ